MWMTGRCKRLVALSVIVARLLLFGVCAAEVFGHSPNPAEAANQTFEHILAVPAKHIEHLTHDAHTMPNALASLELAEALPASHSILLASAVLVRDGPSSRCSPPLFQLFSVYRL